MNSAPIYVRIKEQAFVARMAALKLNANSVAIVFGRTIYLYGTTRMDLLSNECWLRHEVKHVLQWKKEGYILFLLKYLLYSLRYGYKKNPYELEAQAAENDKEILKEVEIL